MKVFKNIGIFILRKTYKGYPYNYFEEQTKKFLRLAFWQKIVGFNRRVPWPVDRTSIIKDFRKIQKGNISPGLSPYCYFDARNGIIIGDEVLFGPFVKIISMNHDVHDITKFVKEKPIILKDYCWIGCNSVVLPGVELGERTIVGAGSVVTKSFPEGHQLIAGNPAKVIRKLSDY